MEQSVRNKEGKVILAYKSHNINYSRWKNAHKVLVRKLEVNRPLWRPINREYDNIKMYLKEIWCESVDWIRLSKEISGGFLLIR